MAELTIVPLSLEEANEFVRRHHRHHQPTVGHKFSIGVAQDGAVVGVAIVGRPLSRNLDDGWTVEVNRICVQQGIKNANSMLYGACKRAAEAQLGTQETRDYRQRLRCGIFGEESSAQLPLSDF